MKKFILFLMVCNFLVAKEAILRLDTFGHTSMVRKIVVTKDRQYFITASDDKTVRVWSSKSSIGNKILGQIGQKGVDGMVFAVALSPDEKYLATGGYFNYKGNRGYGDIRVYDYQSGKLLRVFKSHTSTLNDLVFSDDGKYLISASHDRSVKIWDMRDMTLDETLKVHTKEVYGVKILKKDFDTFIVSIGYDGVVNLISLSKREVVRSFEAKERFAWLDVSREHIAVSSASGKVYILDHNLNLIKKIKSYTKARGVSYSPDGDFMVVGTGGETYDLFVYETKTYSVHSTFKKHNNSVSSVKFLNNNQIISIGGDKQQIYIWDKDTTQVVKKIESVGNQLWSVGIKGNKIAFGTKFDAIGDWHIVQSSFTKSIDLNTFSLSNKTTGFKRISQKYKNYSLTHTRGGVFGYESAILLIKKDGVTQTKIIKNDTNGLEHYCYGFYKDLIVSCGAHGYLKIYNLDGKEVANLNSHTGTIWAIAIDGDRLVSAGSDEVIKIWDLTPLKKFSRYNKEPLKENIDINQADERRRGYLDVVDKKTIIIDKNYTPPKVELYPILNIFVASNDEWIVWTNDGFYNSSPKGDNYLGYHINQGEYKEAQFLPMYKFNRLKREDLITKVLNGENISRYKNEIDFDKMIDSMVEKFEF